MKNICLILLVFCGVSLQYSFGNVTHIRVDTTVNLAKVEKLSQLINLSDSVLKVDSIKLTSKLKKSKAYRLGLGSFGLMSLSYIVYAVLSSLSSAIGWALLPYLFIGIVLIGLIAVGLSIRSLSLYRKEKSKKGIIWPSLALIFGIIPSVFLILVLLALRTFN